MTGLIVPGRRREPEPTLSLPNRIVASSGVLWLATSEPPAEAGAVGDDPGCAQDAAKTSCTTALTTLKTAATASGCPIE